jgi:hypothetical protein
MQLSHHIKKEAKPGPKKPAAAAKPSKPAAPKKK